MRRGKLRWLWLGFLVIIVDQWAKLLVVKHLSLNAPLRIMTYLNLRLTFNTGSAFSFLSSASGWQVWLLVGIAAVVCVFILVWLSRLPRGAHWLAIALALIFGGALGNLIDRILYGYVIDFIDVHVKNWHYPTFNIADSAISVGVIILIICMLFNQAKN